jgi:hypothetical protein
MAPQSRTRQEITELLARAAAQAQHAEAYHGAVGGPGRVEGRAARQAACDAAAMQLIELAGCAEGFGHDRGEPGTTLARLAAALRPILEQRNVHTHPEIHLVPQAVTPRALGGHIEQLKSALGNLDSETLGLLAPADMRVLNRIDRGLAQIEKDGLPDPAALRRRDLHYAGYYREIQFARLAKATGEFDLQAGSHGDPRYRDVRRSISVGDDMAHRFHEMRRGADMNVLPASVVAPDRRDGVPGRPISELIRELRRDYQTALERVTESQMAENAQAREQYRDAVDRLAQEYAHLSGDPKAAERVHAYVGRQMPALELETIDAMREGLRVAADPAGNYRGLPDAVQKACLKLCLGLEEEGDRRLIGILDAADARARAGPAETIYDLYPDLTRDDTDDLERGEDPELDLDFDNERGPTRGR